MKLPLAIAAMLIAAGARDASAQSLEEQCAAFAPWDANCDELVNAALTLPQRVAIVAAGGNPVSGTSSTLGMRTPGSPRWSLAVRSTGARTTLPPIGERNLAKPTIWSINGDASVGLFNGFNLLPTIGGFGSIDALASIGAVSLPDEGFGESSSLTWGLGARVGILRESFTAPGVSVSAMYRSLPDVEYGNVVGGPHYRLTSQSVLSVRGTVGKRILGIGLTGGAGYDRVRHDLRSFYAIPTPSPIPVSPGEDGITSGRTSFFGNLSYTLLILNMAAELGWQANGDAPEDAHEDTGKGGLFGGIAVRLAI